ncbi:UNVERIFIED_CONTAM: hypothetical protein H355_002328 [Colinus virginianus]|nr:hypothetical protein H355_002328 [Colinus virginianus]
MQEKQQRTVPRLQQCLPPLTSTMLETDQPQAGKVSCKKGSEEIPCHLPKIEKGRTLLPPLDMESTNALSLRVREVLANLKSYKVCRDGWRKKVEQNWLHPEENKEYQSFLPKDEVPDFVLEDTAEKKVPEQRERRNFPVRLPPIVTSEHDLLAKERTSAGTRIVPKKMEIHEAKGRRKAK